MTILVIAVEHLGLDWRGVRGCNIYTPGCMNTPTGVLLKRV